MNLGNSDFEADCLCAAISITYRLVDIPRRENAPCGRFFARRPLMRGIRGQNFPPAQLKIADLVLELSVPLAEQYQAVLLIP